MIKLKYVGPHTGVDVPNLATGQTITVDRGKTAEFPDAVAESLLEQGKDHWRPAKAPPTPRPPAARGEA